MLLSPSVTTLHLSCPSMELCIRRIYLDYISFLYYYVIVISWAQGMYGIYCTEAQDQHCILQIDQQIM